MSALSNLYAPSPNSISGKYITVPMLDDAIIYGGAIVAVTTAGFAVPAANTSGLVVVGRAFIRGGTVVDNTNGGNGGKSIVCLLSNGEEWYAYDNDGSVPVVQADLLTDVYVADDHTVGTSGTNSVVAGKFMGFPLDNAGAAITSKCWILFPH